MQGPPPAPVARFISPAIDVVRHASNIGLWRWHTTRVVPAGTGHCDTVGKAPSPPLPSTAKRRSVCLATGPSRQDLPQAYYASADVQRPAARRPGPASARLDSRRFSTRQRPFRQPSAPPLALRARGAARLAKGLGPIHRLAAVRCRCVMVAPPRTARRTGAYCSPKNGVHTAQIAHLYHTTLVNQAESNLGCS